MGISLFKKGAFTEKKPGRDSRTAGEAPVILRKRRKGNLRKRPHLDDHRGDMI